MGQTDHPVVLPLVVQLGFAGSRQLVDAEAHPGVDLAEFEAGLEQRLAHRLVTLRTDLRLTDRHFFCGISAMALGADMVFSRACRASAIPQRAFLPQTRDEFLNAAGDSGPDFPSEAIKEQAVQLLDGPHVIQEQVVSESRRRGDRFDDTNREIVRVSDVLVCLVRAGSVGRAGGTEDLIRHAVLRGKPVLVVRVDVAEGKPSLSEEWRLPDVNGRPAASPGEVFHPPAMPETLAVVTLSAEGSPGETDVARYATAIKSVASPLAKRMQKVFLQMAIWIIATHVIATVMASAAVGLPALHEHGEIKRVVLTLELVMLAVGMTVHQCMHLWNVSHRWAEARLLAEVVRSVQAVGDLHVYLRHLFELPFPTAIRPVLRTINVKHLQSTRQDTTPWQDQRDRYVSERLTRSDRAQIPYFSERVTKYERLLSRFHLAFNSFWAIAFGATLLKLLFHEWIEHHAEWAGVLGTLASVMPVLAAGSLSFAAALDLEAQKHPFKEMEAFLRRQQQNLSNATSFGDFRDLVLETELHLLGETSSWFSRRSFVTVS